MGPTNGGYVDYRSSLALVGTVIKFLAVTLLFPAAIALYYQESLLPFPS